MANEFVIKNGFISKGNSYIHGDTTITGNTNIIGGITGNTIAKIKGSSSQFLKADGSVDDNLYATIDEVSSTYLPLTGGTLTGPVTGITFIKEGSFSDSFLMGDGSSAKKMIETITQGINGVNTIFNLSNNFIKGTVIVYLNGIKERYASELGINQISFQDAPKNDGYQDLIEVEYFYVV